MALSLGQGSGDFAETSGRIQAFHIGVRNSVGILAPDGFTQANPPVITAAAAVSSTLSGITQVGVLGGSIAFARSDAGNGFIGGPWDNSTIKRPLGIFINDANGNAFENTPGVASGRAPYFSGQGCFGTSIYETEDLDASTGALTYAVGDRLFASENGLLTNSVEADNLAEQSLAAATLIGIVKVVPDADNSLLVFDLRI